jgi:beta-1,4-mannosyl-glycoprotein beta-1,4-N-acetylglucosaminyltransferase
MIIDCFPFFNELDLLEIRLNELNDVVDQFVIVEAARTFQNDPKPLFFEENKNRYEKFLPKITHVKINSFPKFNFIKFRKPSAWDLSNFQKNMVKEGLCNCNPDDVIIISDVDEIPKAEMVKKYAQVPGVKVFHQILSYYYLNCVAVECPTEANLYKKNGIAYWKGPVMINYKDFKSFKATRLLHDKPDHEVVPVYDGGWHFSFMGNVDDLLLKIRSWEHAKEFERNHSINSDTLKEIISSGSDLFGRDFKFKTFAFDHCFPAYATEHINKFNHLVCLGNSESVHN